jgi:predicted short-subunit dehydrogenase-like oxidoreductase (DUF2520 family)
MRQTMQIRDIVMIGSGNLATNLALALSGAGKNIIAVYSRTLENAKILAEQCQAKFTNQIEELPSTADLYIIATTDSVIKQLSEKLDDIKGIVVHTSGSIPLAVFSDHIKNYGVFYPLMTFTKQNKVNFSDIPVCLEASSGRILIALHILAKSISKNIVEISSEKRKLLHLSAVFACNFTNVNYSIAEDLLHRNGLSFDLLKPLIIETANRVKLGEPSELQTGPAVREDYPVMHDQMELLNQMPEYKEIYDLLSKLIITIKHKND